MDESVYCKICYKKCFGVTELKIHVETRHKKRLKTDDDGEKPTKSAKKNNDADEMPTKSAKKNNGVVELPTKSLKKNKGDDDKLPTKSFKKNDKSESFIDYNRLERKYVECNVCQEICADESALRKHCEHHLFQNHTKCGICSKNFRSVYGLHEHFKSHRSCMYACNICDEQFKTKEGLSQHVCSKAYPCNVCSHVFRSKDELLKHFFVHKSLQGSYLNFAVNAEVPNMWYVPLQRTIWGYAKSQLKKAAPERDSFSTPLLATFLMLLYESVLLWCPKDNELFFSVNKLEKQPSEVCDIKIFRVDANAIEQQEGGACDVFHVMT
ncbi:hypothetical protein AVEN_44995-1 [Araneus ventricosus]|uniref:C2H2-type domain-containing protein n=1 Tax=Araneus ventricosus TaxID=182803 RepID=A0A4Y2JYQ9_ARAVE|nr:hypothetical protein AVEN_44995-1 [Araneus ventricosus]